MRADACGFCASPIAAQHWIAGCLRSIFAKCAATGSPQIIENPTRSVRIGLQIALARESRSMSPVLRIYVLSSVLSVAGTIIAAPSAVCETFRFGSLFGANLNGVAAGSETVGNITMQLAAGPTGATVSELNSNEMGISSSAIAGAIDPDAQSFNVFEPGSVLAGVGESLRFSFDKPGVLTGINFDGVKDESLEYFVLESTGARVNFFDSAANGPIARHTPEEMLSGSVDQAVAEQLITGQVVLLLEISGADDEARNLSIPFLAGQEFTLTYGELDEALETAEPGNGAQLQSITVIAVPEPAASCIVISGIIVAVAHMRFFWRNSAGNNLVSEILTQF
jgi:hypothetical protein